MNLSKNASRIYPVIASIAIQLTLGIAYVWSVFQTGIAESIFGGNNAYAGITFSLLLSMLGLGGIIGGRIAAKHSTRTVVFIGGIVLGSGFFLSGFVTAQYPWMLWVTYGLMGGLGMGFTYSTTIACAQKWFPNKKGLITGIIVSALGLGGVVFTPVIESLILHFGGQGIGEFPTFMVLGGLFFVVCTVGSIFLKNPPIGYMTDALSNTTTTTISMKPSEVLKKPAFYLITATFMLACMGGLMMIGFAKPIAVAKGLETTATIGVLLISMFNSLGRLFWGFVSDRIKPRNTIIVLLIGSGILSLLVNMANGIFVFVLIGFIGFFYGGFLSNFPSLTAELFGPQHMATNYGMVLFGFGTGAIVSSYIAGYYKNVAGSDIGLMYPAFVIASVCAGVGVLLMLFIPNKSKLV